MIYLEDVEKSTFENRGYWPVGENTWRLERP